MVLITFLFVVVLARLFYVEVVFSDTLTARALDQWTRDVSLDGERGYVYDCNGVALASNMTTYTVYVRPVSVKNPEYTAQKLSETLGVNYDELLAKLVNKVSEVTVAKGVEKEKINELRAGGVTGVYYAQNIKRVYTFGQYLTQALGFTNIDGDGQSGLELFYDEHLQGTDGYVLTETDLVGRELYDSETSYIYGEAGCSVHLTVDSNIQLIVEQTVNAAYATYGAKNVSCVVMDPSNGGIVAMAEAPSYDLNNIPRNDVTKLFSLSKSNLISSVYEPGSTFKILTTAIGLDAAKITRDYNLYCPGYRMIDGQRIKCWRTIGHGSETFDKGVQNSCNCLFMDIACKVGTETFYTYLDDFGLTRKTGVDLYGEASGLLIAKDSVKTVDLARIGFGQAIAVTPIALTGAVASVINGGNAVTPHFMGQIKDKNGRIIYNNAKTSTRRVISENTSDEVKEILSLVVSDGSGRNAGIAGYNIGGKTGTAQKYENKSIAQGKYVSSFIGYIVSERAEYLTLFIVDEPQGYVYYGSMVAAPYVKQIFQGIIDYKQIKPNNFTPEETVIMPDIIGNSLTDAIIAVKAAGLDYELSGENGSVSKQFPIPGAEIKKGSIILIEVK